ncbi:SDR family oxidoreductase [Pullulanibacillus sp. KACC 23026]|uniref:SDR family oxidoreductase n=1 Tax=Pullulanibacillus sp. KACC 23026 TaxID=3028315 RepID=UPI0023AE6BE2|nr:SDR family oxidoreductase [Pullulanibacillus sp. KACC 23026]WEG11781.1 SDR family oxidoreductase [Pullulanibacillus sp. KACC 23026]
MYPTQPYFNKEQKEKTIVHTFPPQHQSQMPGHEHEMNPLPIADNPSYKASGKLKNKIAIITGGDSGIGRAVAITFAKEGAKVAIVYFNEKEDAEATKQMINAYGGQCLLIEKDLREETSAEEAVKETLAQYGAPHILVNNCAVQYPQKSILQITKEQLYKTFETNFFSYFFMAKAVLPHMTAGASIINTASITAYKGNKTLIDYSSTKGAIVSFTRSLSLALAEEDIRVNAVAPGPIWTPLIPASFDADKVSQFGNNTPMKRAGQPFELAPAYVYLASDDSRFMSGQVLHINGGDIVNG